MKKVLLGLALVLAGTLSILLTPVGVIAQSPNPVLIYNNDPVGTCIPRRFVVSIASNNLFFCQPNGTWAQVTGASGGGERKLTPEIVRTSATILTIGSACSASAPCVSRSGNNYLVQTASATATITGSTSTGSVFVGYDRDNVLTVWYTSGLTVTCNANCTAVSAADFPSDAVKLYRWNANTVQGNWDAALANDYRGAIHTDRVEAGTGLIASVGASGVKTLSVSGTDIPCVASTSKVDICDHLMTGWVSNSASFEGGEMQWQGAMTSGGTVNYVTTGVTATRPGIVKFSTGATSGQSAGMFVGGDGPTVHIDANFNLYFTWKLDQTDTNFSARVGLNCNTNNWHLPWTMTSSGVYIEKEGADTDWWGAASNGTESRTSSSLAAISTNFATLHLWRSAAGEISYEVNGGTVRTVTANIPSGVVCVPSWAITNSTTADKVAYADFHRFVVTGVVQ